MNLVPDVANWKKWWSMRFIIATAFLAAIPAAYTLMPDDWLPAIPTGIKTGLALATLFSAGCAGVSRVVCQPKLPPAGQGESK